MAVTAVTIAEGVETASGRKVSAANEPSSRSSHTCCAEQCRMVWDQREAWLPESRQILRLRPVLLAPLLKPLEAFEPNRVWLGACPGSSSTAARASGSALARFPVEGVGPWGENVGVGVPALWRRGTGTGIDRSRGFGVRDDAGNVLQVTPGMRLGHGRHVLRRPFGDQFASAVSRQRPQVDQPVGVLDQIEVVLDQYDGIAGARVATK